MLKVCLSSLLLFSNMFPALQEYKVSINNSHIYINDREVFCECGKPPVSVMFFNGKIEYYCHAHLPEIEFVRPFSQVDLERLLESINAKE